MKAKPTDIDAYLQYICPKCKGEYWIKKIEAMTPGFIIVCDCSNIIKIETIKDIVPIYETSTTTQNYSNTDVSQCIKNAKNMLLSYGYKPKEINKIISDIGNCSSEEELIKKVLERRYNELS